MRLANVDLPQPLSPTTANVSPWSMWSETFVTACTWAWRSAGKRLETFSTRTRGSRVLIEGFRLDGMLQDCLYRPYCLTGVLH